MPFDPKLLLPDEPPLDDGGELQLPDELSALADQLGEDAAYLARCYPAAAEGQLANEGREPPRALRAGSRTRTFLVLSLSAAALSLVALLAVSVWNFSQQPPAQPDLIAAQPLGGPEFLNEQNSPARDQLPGSVAGASTPALTIAELSGPELEAVLDLLERDSKVTTSVAF